MNRVRQVSIALILAAGLTLPAVAQAPVVTNPEARSRALQAVEQGSSGEAVRRDKAARAVAENRQREFAARLSDFADSWNRLIQQANKGGWSAKEARKTREAFERLVRSEGWIEGAEVGKQ